MGEISIPLEIDPATDLDMIDAEPIALASRTAAARALDSRDLFPTRADTPRPEFVSKRLTLAGYIGWP